MKRKNIVVYEVVTRSLLASLSPGGGVLLEFLGGDVPVPELVQLNFATLY